MNAQATIQSSDAKVYIRGYALAGSPPRYRMVAEVDGGIAVSHLIIESARKHTSK